MSKNVGTSGLFNCRVGVAAGSPWPILAGSKANIVIGSTQTCLPIYLLSFSVGEEKRWRGARQGGQWQVKPAAFSPLVSVFAVVLRSCPQQSVCRYQEKNTKGICAPSLYHLSLSLFISPCVLPSLLCGFLFMWQCGHTPLTQLPDNTGGRRRYRPAVWLSPIRNGKKHI